MATAPALSSLCSRTLVSFTLQTLQSVRSSLLRIMINISTSLKCIIAVPTFPGIPKNMRYEKKKSKSVMGKFSLFSYGSKEMIKSLQAGSWNQRILTLISLKTKNITAIGKCFLPYFRKYTRLVSIYYLLAALVLNQTSHRVPM